MDRTVDKVEDEDEEERQAVFMSMGEEAPTLFKCLSIGSTRTRLSRYTGRGPKIALKKGAHLGPLNGGERAHKMRVAHPLLILLARWEC